MTLTDGEISDGSTGPVASEPVRGGSPTSPVGPLRGSASTVLAIGLYLVLAVVVYWNAWRHGVSHQMELGGDQFNTVWFLRWVPFALTHGHNPLFTTFGNYPFGVNLLVNTSVPLLGLLGTPITLAFGPIATYNLLLTLGLAGSATAAYALARRWVRRPAAWVAGLVYGFSPYEIAQNYGGHLNLTFVVLPPLILLAGHTLVVGRPDRRRRHGIVLGGLIVAQYGISSEILASTLVIGAVCGVAAALFGGGRARRALARCGVGAAWAVGVAAVLLAYPVWFTLRGPGHINGPIQLVPEAYRADLLGPLVPDTYMALAPERLVHVADRFANNTAENGSYLGITLVVTLVLGTIWLWRRHVVVRVAASGAAAAFVISLGGALAVRDKPGAVLTGFPLPERIFAKLPLLANTIPVRYSVYVALFAGLILALVLERLHTVLSSRSAHARQSTGSVVVAVLAPGLLAAVCLVPLVPAIPIPTIGDPAIPAYFTSSSLSRTPAGAVVLLYPFPSSTVPNGQLWQAEAAMHFKTPGGYFLVPFGPDQHIGYSPTVVYGADTLTAQVLTALFEGGPPQQTPALRTALLAQLRSWHVTRLLASLGGDPDPARSRNFLTWLMGRPPVRTRDIEIWDRIPSGG